MTGYYFEVAVNLKYKNLFLQTIEIYIDRVFRLNDANGSLPIL